MAEKVPIAWIEVPSVEVAAEYGATPAFRSRIGRLILAHRGIGPAFFALRREVLVVPSSYLSRAERHMIAMVAAAAQDCEYCTQQYGAALIRADDRADLADAVQAKRWRGSDLSARECALCEVAEKMSANPTRMTERDWQPLRDLGFSDEGLLEVGHIVGLMNYATRLVSGFGLLLPPTSAEASSREPPVTPR